MSEVQKPRPIRLTRQRADALLLIFEKGAADAEAALKRAAHYLGDAEAAEALRHSDHQLAAARDAAAIIKARYAGGEAPDRPTPTLF